MHKALVITGCVLCLSGCGREVVAPSERSAQQPPQVLQPSCPNPAPLKGEWKESALPEEGTRYALHLKRGSGAADEQRALIDALAAEYQLIAVRPVFGRDSHVATAWSASISPEMLASLRCNTEISEIWNTHYINVD